MLPPPRQIGRKGAREEASSEVDRDDARPVLERISCEFRTWPIPAELTRTKAGRVLSRRSRRRAHDVGVEPSTGRRAPCPPPRRCRARLFGKVERQSNRRRPASRRSRRAGALRPGSAPGRRRSPSNRHLRSLAPLVRIVEIRARTVPCPAGPLHAARRITQWSGKGRRLRRAPPTDRTCGIIASARLVLRLRDRKDRGADASLRRTSRRMVHRPRGSDPLASATQCSPNPAIARKGSEAGKCRVTA